MLTAILILSNVLAGLQTPPQWSGVTQQIRELEKQVNAAYAANDLPKYFSFYARDLTQWFTTGRTDLPTYEKQWSHFIDTGNRIEAADVSDLEVQVGPDGDAAVATYLLQVKTYLKNGTVTNEKNQETDVWFKRDNGWKIVTVHYSPVPKKGAQLLNITD